MLDAGANVKKVIEDFLRKKLSLLGEKVDRLISVYFDRSSVLCKDGCHIFNNVVKLLNQERAFRDLNNKLEVDFQKSLDAFLLDYSDSVSESVISVDAIRSSSSDSSFNTPRKRPSSSSFETPSCKRLRKEPLNTPTRLFVNTTVTNDNCAVAVSIPQIDCIIHSVVLCLLIIILLATYSWMGQKQGHLHEGPS